jgi:hypothetical protein
MWHLLRLPARRKDCTANLNFIHIWLPWCHKRRQHSSLFATDQRQHEEDECEGDTLLDTHTCTNALPPIIFYEHCVCMCACVYYECHADVILRSSDSW